jgi:hypothetical protein
MDFKTYYNSLTDSERTEFAKLASTTTEYIRIHLITKNKIPRKQLMQDLVNASAGKLTIESLLNFFYS